MIATSVERSTFKNIDLIPAETSGADDFVLQYANPRKVVLEISEIIRPSNKRPIADVCSDSLMVSAPGGYIGLWDRLITPYMIEPMNTLNDRAFEAVIFVGPARTGKTEALIDGWSCANIIDDPGDMMIVQTTKEVARDYSRRRIDRMLRNSPDLQDMQTGKAGDDNTFDKYFKNGMILTLAYPTVSQLSGKDIRYIALTDYDRVADDIGGEGSMFGLASKRTQTFLSRGKTVCESSPGKNITDPKWKRHADDNTHKAPPCKGILSLYNEGDRRRLYWQCKHCNEYFEPAMRNLIPNNKAGSLPQIARSVRLFCDKCGGAHDPIDKKGMSEGGVWLSEGQTIDENGVIYGERRDSKFASFWMEGPAAAFQTWEDIIYKELKAKKTYEDTGDEEPLKTTVNTDQGLPYMPQAMQQSRDPIEIENRSEMLDKRVVPLGVRFLTASIDVQAGQRPRFVVQIVGWGPSADGRGYETWLVDRYNLRYSNRPVDDYHDDDIDERARMEYIDPAHYIEDWDILITKVINRSYPLQTDPTKEMKIMITACDSGGEDGVTDTAYKFARRIRTLGLNRKFILVKGGSTANAPRIKVTTPDSSKNKKRKTIATGDVKLTMLNTLILKDRIAKNMERKVVGSGYMHHPDWLGSWFYDELTYEVRKDNGWEKPGKGNNEAFDLYVYCTAGYLTIGGEKINWERPPSWAREWNENNMIQAISDHDDDNIAETTLKPIQYRSQKPLQRTVRRVKRRE